MVGKGVNYSFKRPGNSWGNGSDQWQSEVFNSYTEISRKLRDELYTKVQRKEMTMQEYSQSLSHLTAEEFSRQHRFNYVRELL